MRTIAILFIILLLLIAYAVSGARTYSAPASSRATFTPIAEVTPAPTYAPAPYPGPNDQRPKTIDERRSTKATPAPERGGLRCGHC